MRLYRHPEGVFYYTQERNTLRWYPARSWHKEVVKAPVGTLLAAGAPEKVMQTAAEAIPPELHETICAFYKVGSARPVAA